MVITEGVMKFPKRVCVNREELLQLILAFNNARFYEFYCTKIAINQGDKKGEFDTETNQFIKALHIRRIK